MDLVLAGKAAIVEGIEQDYEDRVLLSVTVEDDPGRDLGDARERALVEFSALTFLWQNGVRTIPHPVRAAAGRDCAIYGFTRSASSTSRSGVQRSFESAVSA